MSRRNPCTDARPTETCVAPVDASRDFLFSFFLRRSSVGGGGGTLPDFFLLFSFPCSADYERDWPPCKIVFRVGNQYVECEKQQQQHFLNKYRWTITTVYCCCCCSLHIKNRSDLYPVASLSYSSRQRNEFPWSQANPK